MEPATRPARILGIANIVMRPGPFALVLVLAPGESVTDRSWGVPVVETSGAMACEYVYVY